MEKRNDELERRVRELTPTATAAVLSRAAGPGAAATAAATGTPAAPQWGDRVQALEQEQRTLAQQVQGLVRPLDVPEGADAGPSFEGTVVARSASTSTPTGARTATATAASTTAATCW